MVVLQCRLKSADRSGTSAGKVQQGGIETFYPPPTFLIVYRTARGNVVVERYQDTKKNSTSTEIHSW